MQTKINRAVFLDRDGVLNRAFIRSGKSYPPQSVEEFELLPGVPEALHNLKQAGFMLVVVTNQPDVAKGIQDRKTVEAMNDKLRQLAPLDLVKVCYHVDEDKCRCRKPKPGMLHEAARELSIDVAASYMVGDRWRDVEAGQAAGCKTFFVKSDLLEEQQPENPDWVVSSLLEASRIILKSKSKP